jgi:Flp pilus assembly pilin Flp
MNIWQRFYRDDDGTTAIEYCLMMFLIIVVCIVGISALGDSNNGLWGRNSNELNAIM